MASLARRLLLGRGLLPMLALFGLILTSLVLMSHATENSARFGRLFSWLLLSSSAGLLVMAGLILRHLWRLVHQYRSRAPGARLTLRLVVMFVVIAMAPVAVVYYFSLQFLQRGIDSWFDVRVESALNDALELSRTALDLRMREVLKLTVRMADELAGTDEAMAALSLGEMRAIADATELTYFALSGRIIASASADPLIIVPDRPSEFVLLQVRQGHAYVGLEPIQDVGFHIRAVVQVPQRSAPGPGGILQALFPVADRFSLLADSVQAAYDTYKELLFMRAPLKTSFILTLSLVLLLGVLGAIWAAFYSARRLVEPVRDLAEGTRAVAAGRYGQQLPLSGSDELGFLVQSFNEMTRKLAEARDAAQRSQQLLERQRAYLEAVLARLSSGVLTLEHNGRLRTWNAAAAQILETDLAAVAGRDLAAAGPDHPRLLHLWEAITPHLTAASGDWRQEITLFGSAGRQVLMCRGSSLPDAAGVEGGHIIVFDDITTLVQAERDAAWAEVARRLAHEIKNPLTPIQLAAERIRHKYLKALGAEEGRVLERGTHTIVQQVHAMKEMVDAFNEYARPPQLRLAPVRLNDLVTEVLDLYRGHPEGVALRLDLDPAQPVIDADSGRLRQLLHNLLKNALEAVRDGHGSGVTVTTRCGHEANADWVELVVADDGPGFPGDLLGKVFEPYVTTKPKGTGLGLAIVKKIVEEHGGLIRAESPAEGGARIGIRFPIHTAGGKAAPPPTAPIALADSEETG